MATIADELLNDFDDSGSEQGDAGDDQNDGLFGADAVSPPDLKGSEQNGQSGMDLDDDEEEVGDAALDGGAPSHLKLDNVEDEEETKARVEKMQLADVGDVRSVARLMRQLKPVVEVRVFPQCYLVL